MKIFCCVSAKMKWAVHVLKKPGKVGTVQKSARVSLYYLGLARLRVR